MEWVRDFTALIVLQTTGKIRSPYDINTYRTLSQLIYQSNIKLHCPFYNFDPNVFVVSVDAAALIGGQVSGRKAIHMVGYAAIMAAVGARDHQVRTYDAVRPGFRHCFCKHIPCWAVGFGDDAWVYSVFTHCKLDVLVAHNIPDIFHSAVNIVVGIQPQVGNKRS